MALITINLFGAFEVRWGDVQITGFRSDKARALLAYLAVEACQSHRRDALAGLLWPNLPEKNAHDNLRLTLHRLRNAFEMAGGELPATILQVTPKTIRFNPSETCQVDVAQFNERGAYHFHEHEGLETCPTCLHVLMQAIEMYRGDLLAGFFVDSPLFEEWLLIKRETLRCYLLEMLSILIVAEKQRGEYAQAIAYARRSLALDPWNEHVHYQLMHALALTGQRSAALHQYETCAHVLAAELGTVPGDQVRGLYENLRAG